MSSQYRHCGVKVGKAGEIEEVVCCIVVDHMAAGVSDHIVVAVEMVDQMVVGMVDHIIVADQMTAGTAG